MGRGCCTYRYIYILIGISLGLERGRKVYFRESEIAIEMSLNQGRLVHIIGTVAPVRQELRHYRWKKSTKPLELKMRQITF